LFLLSKKEKRMSQFFQNLIALGEERGTDSVASEDLSTLSSAELISHVAKLELKLVEQRQEYDKLQSDSLSLRSEYDAYKRKVDGWQRQMKDARSSDKKMIEELRAAGSSGKIDDVFMKTTNDTIQQLKENLREAQEEVQKAFRRQREAEESRVAAEQSKKHELEALGSKFDSFKERSKAHQERLEAQLAELRGTAAKESNSIGASSPVVQQLKQQLEASERQRAALQRRLEAAGASVEHVGGAVDNTDHTSSGAHHAATAEEVTSLQEEIAALNTQIALCATKETEFMERIRKSEEKLQRQVEDAQWESLEAGKRMAEAKTEVDMLKTRVSQLESKLDSKDEEYTLNEKQARRSIRDLEDALAAEKERHAADTRGAHQQRMQLEEELQRERERLQQNSELMGEAENASRKVHDSLEAQRQHFEKLLREKDTIIQQSHSVRESLELSLQEAKEDARRDADFLDDLKRELEQSSERITELEHQQLISQRALTAREDEVQSREHERQKLRALLREEEETNGRLRSTAVSLETRVTEMELEFRRKDNALHELTSARDMAHADLLFSNNTIAELNKTTKAQEIRLQELSSRIQDQGVRNSDILKLREDQNSQIRNLEQRNTELQSELAQARYGSGGDSSHISSSSHAVDMDYVKPTSTPAAFRKQIVADAMAAVRQQRFLTASNYRQLIMIGVGLFLLLSMFGGFHTATQTTNMSETESINNLREKYGQALLATSNCREMLSSAKEQVASLCACTK
jgi:chromosome segregation ATPase